VHLDGDVGESAVQQQVPVLAGGPRAGHPICPGADELTGKRAIAGVDDHRVPVLPGQDRATTRPKDPPRLGEGLGGVGEDVQHLVGAVAGDRAVVKSIGEVAAQFGLPTHVLRHWESEGLLAPARAGSRRRYSEADVYRVAAILVAKDAGLGLPDIRAVLAARSAPARHEVMARHEAALTERIARAQAGLAMLAGGQACAHDDIMNCPQFRKRLDGLLTSRAC
jgi:MerR family copper efflux transcriptional regulator